MDVLLDAGDAGDVEWHCIILILLCIGKDIDFTV